jgi:hypothetical protein
VGVLWIVVSKKFILLSDSISAVNFMFWWILLKSFCMLLMLVFAEYCRILAEDNSLYILFY